MRAAAVVVVVFCSVFSAGVAHAAAPSVASSVASSVTSQAVSALGAQLRSTTSWLPHLHLDESTITETALLLAPTLPTMELLPASRSELPVVPQRYAWVDRETRAFWYAAGAAAFTALGAHVLIGVPVLALTYGLLASAGAGVFPIVTLGIALGVGGAYGFVESLLSSLAAVLVFNGMSEVYEGDYLTALAAHFAGSVAATAVTAMTFGGGLLLFHGVGLLADFTGSAGIQNLFIFSLLGAMPAVVISGIALIAVPALVTAWALSVSAHAKPGYVIDDHWLSQAPTTLTPTTPALAQRELGREPERYTLTLPLPVP